mgnify:CR=1 FL=1
MRVGTWIDTLRWLDKSKGWGEATCTADLSLQTSAETSEAKIGYDTDSSYYYVLSSDWINVASLTITLDKESYVLITGSAIIETGGPNGYVALYRGTTQLKVVSGQDARLFVWVLEKLSPGEYTYYLKARMQSGYSGYLYTHIYDAASGWSEAISPLQAFVLEVSSQIQYTE